MDYCDGTSTAMSCWQLEHVFVAANFLGADRRVSPAESQIGRGSGKQETRHQSVASTAFL